MGKAVQDNRPVNLDLSTIRLPITAITSILHRISGVILFVGMPFLLCWLGTSLASESAFNLLHIYFGGFFPRLVAWGIVSALIYHFFAGIKHLVMDLGYGETIEGGKKLSIAVLVVSGLFILLAGVWIW